MKGQFFIVITVFLVGLMSATQFLLSNYSSVDMSAVFSDKSYYLMSNIRENIVNITSSIPGNCPLLKEELENYRYFMAEASKGEAYSINIVMDITCPNTVKYQVDVSKKTEQSTMTS